DGATGRTSRHPYDGLRRLARRAPIGGRLAAVVDRIDDEVLESVGDAVEDLLVELDVFTGHLDADLLARGRRDVTRDTWQGREDAAHRHHREAHRAVTHLGHVTAVTFGEFAHATQLPLERIR